MISLKRTAHMLGFIYKNKQWRTLGWYWRNGYFHKQKPSVYLLGYRDGCSDYSWCANFFAKPLPVDVKLSRKDVMELGYAPFCGIGPDKIEPCDYYIAREFGE